MESNKTVWWVVGVIVVLGLIYWAMSGSSETPSPTVSGTTESGAPVENTVTSGSSASPATTASGSTALKYTQLNAQQVTLVDGVGSPKSLGVADHGVVRTVRISSVTQLLNKSRGVLEFSQIQKGDTVNVYGSLSKDGSLDALILRDLSRPTGVAVGSVSISSVAGPALVATGLQSTWTIDADVPGTETITYTANWQDGSPVDALSNPVFTHIYTKAGVYVIKFTVKSSSGKTANWMQSVNVVTANQ